MSTTSSAARPDFGPGVRRRLMVCDLEPTLYNGEPPTFGTDADAMRPVRQRRAAS